MNNVLTLCRWYEWHDAHN